MALSTNDTHVQIVVEVEGAYKMATLKNLKRRVQIDEHLSVAMYYYMCSDSSNFYSIGIFSAIMEEFDNEVLYRIVQEYDDMFFVEIEWSKYLSAARAISEIYKGGL